MTIIYVILIIIIIVLMISYLCNCRLTDKSGITRCTHCGELIANAWKKEETGRCIFCQHD